jgi:hypothetical protein
MAGIELATAYVSIVPSAKGIQGKLAAEMGAAAPVGGMSHSLRHGAGMIGLALGATAIEHFFHAGFEAAESFHRQELLTAAVIRSTGEAAHVSAEHVLELATSLGKTDAVTRGTVVGVENMLLRFSQIKNSGADKVFDRATAAVLDLSAATGRDGVSSARMLGKALNDPVTQVGSLTRAGVSFTAEQKKQIKTVAESGDLLAAQGMILDGVTKAYGGSARALATPTQRLAVAFKSFRAGVGATLLPVVEDAATALTDHLLPALKTIPTTIQANWHLITPILDGVGNAFRDLWETVVNLWAVLQPVAGLLAGAFIGAFRLLVPLIAAAASGVRELSGVLSEHRSVVSSVAVAVIGMWAAWKGFTLARAALIFIVEQLLLLPTRFGPAIAAVRAFGLASSVALGIVGIAIGIGVYLWQQHNAATKEAKQIAADQADTIKTLTDAINADNGALGEATRKAVYDTLVKKGAIDVAKKYGLSLMDVVDAAMGNVDALNRLYAAEQKSAISADKNREEHGKLTAAIGTTDEELTKGQQAHDDYAAASHGTTKAVDGTTVAMQSQEDTAKQLKSSLDELSGKSLTAAQSELDLQSQLDGLSKSVKDNGKALTGTNRKTGLFRSGVIANRQALLSAIQTINDHATAVYDQTGSVESATGAMQRDESQLRRSAIAAGLNKDQVDKLITRYAAVPGDVKTDLQANVDPAQAAIQKFKAGMTDPANKAKIPVGVDLRPVDQAINSYQPPHIVIPATIVTQGNIGGHKVSTAATGGYLSSAGWTLTGEQGPELVSPSGMVHTAGDTVDKLVSAVSDRVGGAGAPMRVAGGAVSLTADSQGNLHAWVRDVVLAEAQFGATTSRMRVP